MQWKSSLLTNVGLVMESKVGAIQLLEDNQRWPSGQSEIWAEFQHK